MTVYLLLWCAVAGLRPVCGTHSIWATEALCEAAADRDRADNFPSPYSLITARCEPHLVLEHLS
jgi:hypothetical protein